MADRRIRHFFRRLLGTSLSRDEVLIAIGDQTNEALNAVEGLLRRHIVAATPGSMPPTLQTRHPLIAEILLDELQRQRRLADVLPGLILAAAAKADPRAPRHSRNWRLLQRLINHDFLANSLDREAARNAYGNLETLLSWDYHYWLQRGSFEVEFGDLSHADLFLKTAAGMQPDEPLVQTEMAYLGFKKAIANPAAISASELVDQATASLEDLIARRGRTDPYPYHVLGSQGLAWARHGIASPAARGRYLARLLKRLEEGLARHPTRVELKQLHDDAKRRYLETALPS
jgi:hypothetical protein